MFRLSDKSSPAVALFLLLLFSLPSGVMAQEFDFGGGEGDSPEASPAEDPEEDDFSPTPKTDAPESVVDVEEATDGELAEGDQKEETTSSSKRVSDRERRSVLRGFYLDTRFGGLYTVAQPDLTPTAEFPALSGSESFGAGAYLQLSIGYDIIDFLAIELVGGASFLSGGRDDWVRDLGLYYGGAMVRGGYVWKERLFISAAVGAGYGRADNLVDAPNDGLVILANAGVEYFVHIRHFSIGAAVTAMVELEPSRVFIGLGPTFKYTF